MPIYSLIIAECYQIEIILFRRCSIIFPNTSFNIIKNLICGKFKKIMPQMKNIKLIP